MHSPAQLFFQLFELTAHLFPFRLAQNREISVALFLPADVREAKKVKGFRFPLSSTFTVAGCPWTELYQSRLFRMQFKPEFGETRLQLFQETIGLVLELKPTMKSSANLTTITSPRACVFLQ